MTPKERLLQDKKLTDAILEMTSSSTFEQAADITLLQVIHDLGDTTDELPASAVYHRLMGARAFLSKLKTIATRQLPPPRRTIGDNLNHNR